jgi:hypothetical protein
MYKSAVEVKDAVKRWSTLTLQREFRVVKSSPYIYIYDVKCLKSNYPFRVDASKGKWKNYWEIKSVVDHTCVLEQLDASHRNLSSGFVAKIVENPTFEPKSIILAIEKKFRYHISYGKAYMAKKKVMEMRWGTYEASYDKTPPPLCDFMQWLDCEQSEQDKRYVEETGRSTRERWQRMVEVEKQEQNVRSSSRKFAFGGRSKNVKRPRPVKQIERGRGRELAGLRKLGQMLRGRGNIPVVPSRRRVLDAECYCIHKKL